MEDDLLELGKETAKSSLWLTIGQGVSTAIGGLLTIIIARMLEPAGYGLYSVALIPIMIFSIVRDWGIMFAATRYISRGLLKTDDPVPKYISTTFFFEITNGTLLTLLVFLFAHEIAVDFLGKPEAGTLIQFISIMLLFQGIFVASYAVLNAFGVTKYIAFSQLIGAIFRTVLTLYLLFTGWGVLGALLGFLSYFVVAGLVSFFFVIREVIRKSFIYFGLDLKILKEMLIFGSPLMVNALFETVGLQSLNALASNYSTLIELGNYFAAFAVLTIVVVFNMPLIQALLPSFSKVDTMNNYTSLYKVYRTSIHFSSLLLIPVIFGLIGLSKPLIFTIYGLNYSEAPLYLMFLSFAYIALAMGLIPITSFFMGTGSTKEILIGKGSAYFIGLLIALFMIPIYKIVGLIIALNIIYFISLFNFYILVKRKFGFSVDYVKLFKIFIASFIMFLIVYFYSYLATDKFFTSFELLLSHCGLAKEELIFMAISVLGAIIGLFVYSINLALLNVLNEDDFNILRHISTALGPFGKIIKMWMILIKKLKR